MAIKFNPLTGNFDFTGSGGGGGGASYIDGEVAVYTDLSLDAGVAPLNTAWLVREASGTWLIARKPAGIYVRTATGGTDRNADWTYAGILPDVFSDANFLLYDDADSSKNLAFQLSGITTGTTRTLTVPDANITLDDATDTRDPNAHAASHAAGGTDELFDQDLATSNDVQFNSVTTGALEVAGLEIRDNNEYLTRIEAAPDALTAGITVNTPPTSGTLALTSDIPTELTDLAATGITAGKVLAADGDDGAEWVDAPSGGGGGEVRSDFVSPYTYTGLADAGTSESTASWTIRRSEFDAGGSFVATLTASAVEWDDRLTASYA